MFVLIVDDEELIRRLIKKQLAGTGLEVLEAGSTEDAAILIGRYSKKIVAMAVTSLLAAAPRPGFNAYCLVQEARKDLGQDVPIIAMSSDGLINTLLMEAGCNHQTLFKNEVAAMIRGLLQVAA